MQESTILLLVHTLLSMVRETPHNVQKLISHLPGGIELASCRKRTTICANFTSSSALERDSMEQSGDSVCRLMPPFCGLVSYDMGLFPMARSALSILSFPCDLSTSNSFVSRAN